MVKEESRQILLSVFGIAILLIAVVGISYAIFSYTASSSSENIIKSGGISMSFIESDSNFINLVDAMPMEDNLGIVQEEYFDFILTSTINGITNINYSIVATAIDTPDQLDSKYVKIYLEKEENGIYKSVFSPTTFMRNSSDLISKDGKDNSMLLYNGLITSSNNQSLSKTDKFRLRMWLDSSTPIYESSKNFKLKINVAATS